MKENKMDKRYFSRKEMLALDGHHARLQAAAELFGDALDAEDEETLEALCKWASSCEEEAIFLPLGFQFSCLSWLTDYYQERWRRSEDGSAEEKRSWKGLANCLWNFKWIVAHLPQDLLMDEEALESANNMMLAYYQAFELGLSAYHKVLMKQAMLRGDAIVAISENNPYHYLQYLLAVAPFQTEALAEAEKLAARFDQRNGNHFYQMQLAVEFHKQDTLH